MDIAFFVGCITPLRYPGIESSTRLVLDRLGVNLQELAEIMVNLGAADALNLDGGGSATLIVKGVLLNRPTGGTSQREVMSALVTTCR